MKNYYKTHQLYGKHPVAHGLRSHPLVLEWLDILHNKYHELDDREILNYEIRIANWIRCDMHWENTYKTKYDPHTKCLTVSGFPKYGYPDYFKVNKVQLEFLLHRIRYNKATVYYKNQSVVKIHICKTRDWDLKDKRVFNEQWSGDTVEGMRDCNVLSHDVPICPPRRGGNCP